MLMRYMSRSLVLLAVSVALWGCPGVDTQFVNKVVLRNAGEGLVLTEFHVDPVAVEEIDAVPPPGNLLAQPLQPGQKMEKSGYPGGTYSLRVVFTRELTGEAGLSYAREVELPVSGGITTWRFAGPGPHALTLANESAGHIVAEWRITGPAGYWNGRNYLPARLLSNEEHTVTGLVPGDFQLRALFRVHGDQRLVGEQRAAFSTGPVDDGAGETYVWPVDFDAPDGHTLVLENADPDLVITGWQVNEEEVLPAQLAPGQSYRVSGFGPGEYALAVAFFDPAANAPIGVEERILDIAPEAEPGRHTWAAFYVPPAEPPTHDLVLVNGSAETVVTMWMVNGVDVLTEPLGPGDSERIADLQAGVYETLAYYFDPDTEQIVGQEAATVVIEEAEESLEYILEIAYETPRGHELTLANDSVSAQALRWEVNGVNVLPAPVPAGSTYRVSLAAGEHSLRVVWSEPPEEAEEPGDEEPGPVIGHEDAEFGIESELDPQMWTWPVSFDAPGGNSLLVRNEGTERFVRALYRRVSPDVGAGPNLLLEPIAPGHAYQLVIDPGDASYRLIYGHPDTLQAVGQRVRNLSVPDDGVHRAYEWVADYDQDPGRHVLLANLSAAKDVVAWTVSEAGDIGLGPNVLVEPLAPGLSYRITLDPAVYDMALFHAPSGQTEPTGQMTTTFEVPPAPENTEYIWRFYGFDVDAPSS